MNERETRPPESTAPGTPRRPRTPSLGPSLPQGNYRILQKLGEGGMGEVYEAEQLRPVRRLVALKVIKAGMDSKQVVARFESERQALALMNHPNIARVYDAGVTGQGRPYIAMEYVKGEAVTDYCDRHRLTTDQRLELFVQICEGVQHAHQKGVIHRDIKPSNVLVRVQGDRPLPKIIDFGVAKATAQRLTDKTLLTQMGMMVGTPEYMSPEQAEMTGLDIDTRSDVYSLGVLLYVLLVGTLPFDSADLREAGYEEIRRRIREDEPSKPSTRITTLGHVSAESARRRGTELSSLRRELRGDLDWITMKAMEKDRTRRYGSPNELAADVHRHLAHQPVVAGPPSTLYRMRKFVRRHRVGVVAASLVFGAMVLGMAGAAWGLVRASRAEHAARQEAATAEHVSDFLVDLFRVSDPSEARGNTITAREILDRGTQRIGLELSGQAQVRTRLQNTMGTVYHALGLYPEAAALLEESLRVRRTELGARHPEALTSANDLANVYWSQGRYEDAGPLYLATLEARREVLGAEHADTLLTQNDLANLYWSQGRYELAEPLYLDTLEARRRLLGPEHEDTLSTVNDLAVLYDNQQRYAEAEPLYVTTLAAQRRTLGEDHPATLQSMNNLAILYRKQQRYAAAEPLYAESLRIRRRTLGERHHATLNSKINLGLFYVSLKRYAEAEPLYLEALAGLREAVGASHPNTLTCLYNLACLAALRGERAAAIDYLHQAVEGGIERELPLILRDSDLDSLRGDPEFEALAGRVRRRLGSS